jgi:hypothetical protein
VNRRSLNQWLGAVLFAFGAGALAWTFPPGGLLAAQVVLMAVAGALLFASGVTDRVRWATLVGLGNVALGASLAVSGVSTLGSEAGTGDLFYAALVVVGGLALAGIGVLYVVGHESFDTEP